MIGSLASLFLRVEPCNFLTGFANEGYLHSFRLVLPVGGAAPPVTMTGALLPAAFIKSSVRKGGMEISKSTGSNQLCVSPLPQVLSQ